MNGWVPAGSGVFEGLADVEMDAADREPVPPGPSGNGVSDHAAVLYELTPDDPDAGPLRVLVWNAQDWKDAKAESVANRARGDALIGMLAEHKPDLVVLLETGQAGRPNTFLTEYVNAASRESGVPYLPPGAVGRDDATSDHDKGIVYFASKDIHVGGAQYYPLGKGERRPLLLLDVNGTTLAFLHAIAASGAASQQVPALLGELKESKISLLAGDLNHQPPGRPDASEEKVDDRPKRMRGASVANKPQVVSTGQPTHYSTTRPGNPESQLDWGYSVAGNTPGTWTATRITDRPDGAGNRVAVWRGVGEAARVRQARADREAHAMSTLLLASSHVDHQDMLQDPNTASDAMEMSDAAHLLASMGGPGLVLANVPGVRPPSPDGNGSSASLLGAGAPRRGSQSSSNITGSKRKKG